MDYFKTLLKREYDRLKTGTGDLIELEVKRRIAETAGIDIGISAEKLIGTIRDIERTEEDLRVAMSKFEDHHDVKDNTIARVAHHIFSGYEQHSNVTVKQDPNYEGLARALDEREKQVSCVVHYDTSVFDPRIPGLWAEHGVEPGENVVFYFHNLNGNTHSLEELTRYVGATAEEEAPEYIEDVHEIRIKDGFHMRPAMLTVEKTTPYDRAVYVRKQGGQEADAKSMLQMLTMSAEAGEKLIFRFEKPITPKQEEQLQGIRDYIKKLISSEDINGLLEERSKRV